MSLDSRVAFLVAKAMTLLCEGDSESIVVHHRPGIGVEVISQGALGYQIDSETCQVSILSKGKWIPCELFD